MPRRATASAPARIDLAGGTLDIWPLSVMVPGAMTVNLAVELRARATATRTRDAKLRVASADRGRRATRRLPLDEGDIHGPLSLLLRLAGDFVPANAGGVEVATRAAAPAGAGMGGSSTLAIATGAALAAVFDLRLGRAALLRRVMDLETRELRVPTGNQDYLAALHGGLAAYHHEIGGTRREPLRVPRGLEGRLVLAYTGRPRDSGFSNWDMFRRYVDGEGVTVRRMEAIARIARETRDALAAGDVDATGKAVGEEGRLRDRLAPTVSTAELRAAAGAARQAGALGVKVCGAGGGGCLVAVAREGRRDHVEHAVAAAGARPLPCRISRGGVRVC